MRILVTGATGFIGARLLARLASEADVLRVLRRRSASTSSIKNVKYEDVIGDITNREDVRRAVKDCDVVFHVAALVSYWDKLKEEQYNVNVNGTRYIVDACLEAGVKRLVHTSTIVAIGLPSEGCLADEKTPYNLWPLRIGYCDTKYLAEVEVQRGVREGLDAVIVNPGAVFGPGDMRRFRGHLYGGTVWTRVFYVGGGIATVDVDDVVEGHIRAWQKGKKGERYILANENLTFKEISDTIAEVMGKSPHPPFLGSGPFAATSNKPPASSALAGGDLTPWGMGGIINKIRIRIPTPVVFAIAYLATAFSRLTCKKPVATIPMAKFTRTCFFFSNEKARRELGVNFRPLRESVRRSVDWFREHGHLKG